MMKRTAKPVSGARRLSDGSLTAGPGTLWLGAFVALAVLSACGFAAAQEQEAGIHVPLAARTDATRGKMPAPRRQLQYLVAPDDLLDIYVVDVPELSREYRVSPDGTLTLPLLQKPISAQGLTPNQLSAVVSDRLRTAQMVSDPHVIVTVKSSRAHSVAIMGAVRRPQIYTLFGTTTLLDVLSQAEGLADDAGNTALVTRGDVAQRSLAGGGGSPGSRHAGVGDVAIRVDLKKLLESGDPSLNLLIYPGDKVTVERAGVVYVVGAVHRPGGFTLKNDHEDMTVLKAIALGEGMTSTAMRKNALIIRQSRQIPGGRQEIRVNLVKVFAGRAPDQPLRPNDILFVPDSTSKKALKRSAEAALQIATGVIIFRR